MSTESVLNHLVLYCRSGFEKECAAEIAEQAALVGISGYLKAKPGDGYVLYVCHQNGGAEQALQRIDFEQMIFARQWFAAGPMLDNLPSEDRISGLLVGIQNLGACCDLSVEHADTNTGKELSRLCRKITHPLRAALKKTGG